MPKSYLSAVALTVAALTLVSCGVIHNQSAGDSFEFGPMGKYLTSADPSTCGNYHYNYERKAPRLYADGQIDSLLDVIDYIKTECGPASNLEVTRLLLLSERGQFGDSLIGRSTIPQMVVYRIRHEPSSILRNFKYLYPTTEPIDNTHDNFQRFENDLAQRVTDDSNRTETERLLARFYTGDYDAAFSELQSSSMRGTVLRKSYDNFVSELEREYRGRGNVAIYAGGWQPYGGLGFLGNHPQIGIQMGGEMRWWRIDGVIDYRFLRAENKYSVDSLGQSVSTDKFNSLLLGVDAGFKIFDNEAYSTDLFVGVGYDFIVSVTEAADPNKTKLLNSLGLSVGIRHRFFLYPRSGWYVGGILRYSTVDYSNPGGTGLSGNALTLSVVTGWSFHETLYQILNKLNYKGSRRP